MIAIRTTYLSRKVWRKIMTATGALVLLLFMVSATANAQTPILDRKVRIPEQTTTVRKLLEELSIAGGFSFSYGNDVPLEKQIRIVDKSQSIREHLEEIFRGDSLTYVEKGRKILIVPDKSGSRESNPNQTIKGRIVDLDSNLPLIGVNVVLGSEGTPSGTITDRNGYFRFENIPVGRHDLKCSYIGYEPRLISNFLVASGKEQVLNIALEESVINLDEVEIESRSLQSKPINDLTRNQRQELLCP